MIIDCISDLHGEYPELAGGDLLIIAGDLTATDLPHQYDEFNDWLCDQVYDEIIVIAGNHDGCLRRKDWPLSQLKGIYLEDSGYEFEGLKIWGSPWTPEFWKWHFMLPRGKEIKAKWDLIPDDIDILVTHGPPMGVLDTNIDGEEVGCEDLRNALERIKPKLHVFGHIHEGYGTERLRHDFLSSTICVNASYLDENYISVNEPIRVIL